MHPQSLFDPAGLADLQAAGAPSGTHAVLAAHLRRWLDNHQRVVGGENVAGYAVMARSCGDRDADINWAKASLLNHVDQPWPMTRWPQQDPPGYSDLLQASAILNAAIGYDMLHQFLTPDERTRCQNKLRQVTGNFANAADGGIWWVRDLVQNHNWVNFAAIGIAGQALEGEETAAGHWRAIAQENYRKVKAVQDLIVDGSWHEGLGYMEFGLLPAIAHAMGATRRGNDNDKTSLLAKVGRYVLYTQLPNHPRIHVVTHGDWNWTRPGLVAILRWAARRCADPYAQEAARRWDLEARNTTRDEYAFAYALEYVAFDPGVPPLDLTTVPLDIYNEDQQSVIMRTSWRYGPASPEADGLVICYKTGVLGGRGNFERIKQDRQNPHPDPGGILNIGHDHMDDLGLWIYGRGGWLLPEHVDYNCCTAGDLTGYSTTEHNSILVDGKGQYGDDRNAGTPKHDAVSNPWFFDREASMQTASTDTYAFARGDGRLLYPPAANLQTLLRTVGLSRDDGFITMHDHAVLTAAHTVGQLFHYLNPDDPSVTADRPWLKLNNDIPASGDTPRSDTLLGVRVLAPTGFTTTVQTVRSHGSYFVTIDNDGRFGRLTVATPTPQTSATFLEVLWPAKATQWNLRPMLQPLDTSRPELGFQIDLGGGTERWIYNTSATARAGGLALESAQVGVVRTDTGGALQRLVLLGQGSLTQDGTTTRMLLANPRPGAVEVALSEAGTRADLSGGDGRLAGIRFHGPDVVAVWANDRQAPFTREGDIVTVGNVDEQTRTAAGTTPKGNTNWITYPDNGPQLGLYVDVDTSAAGFTRTPVYVISLGGDRLHWDTTGGSSVYDERPGGFRVYVRWADRTKPPPTPTEANGYGWHINWMASEL